MTTLTQGSFTIDATGSKVTIGENPPDPNQIQIAIKNDDAAQSKVKVMVGVKCGQKQEALLDETTATTKLSATYPSDKTTADLQPSQYPGSLSWQTLSKGVPVDKGSQLSISLSGFVSNTPLGDAVVAVLVQTYKNNDWDPSLKNKDIWSSVTEFLTVKKDERQPGAPTIHYFTVNPDYILHAGQTSVKVRFYATQFESITLYRNNQEVQNWPSNEHPKSQDGSITGEFNDTPSITTVYRLEGFKVTKTKPEKTRYRTVQVISPGWNQIALPQGYPTRLFVNQDFSGSGVPRLYGIFIDGNNKAALYSSATGVDDWRPEPGEVPQHMATSPGVAYHNKLWLIGGSSVDPKNVSNEVWCYDTGRWMNKLDPSDSKAPPAWSFPETTMARRMGHVCVVFQEELWVLGGYNNGDPFNDVWKFDGNKWEVIKTTNPTEGWTPRLMHAAVCFLPDPPAEGEEAPPAEVYVYGGADIPAPEKGLQDLWLTSDGKTWKQLATREARGIIPPPGPALAAALVATGGRAAPGRGGAATAARLFLGGTFLEDEKSNRIRSLIFELKRRKNVWQQSPVIDGWEQFEGGFFYMQAIAFNGFLFVWSLLRNIPKAAPPKLNILIPR